MSTMTKEQLQNVTMTTSKLLESSPEEFVAYLETLTLGDLLGLKNYLEAEFERVRQMKDLLVEKCASTRNCPTKVTETITGMFDILALIENRHAVILKFIESKREG